MSGSCSASPWRSAPSASGDDFLKVTKRNTKGVPGKMKLGISLIVAGVAAYFAAQGSPAPLRDTLALPFLKDVLMPLGWLLHLPSPRS